MSLSILTSSTVTATQFWDRNLLTYGKSAAFSPYPIEKSKPLVETPSLPKLELELLLLYCFCFLDGVWKYLFFAFPIIKLIFDVILS